MLSIKVLAAILIALHILSDVFIGTVLKKQYELLSVKIDRELRSFRMVLFFLSVAIFAGNVIPIVIDGLTIFYHTNRPAHVPPISVAYAASTALVALISAVLIWFLYRLAANTKEMTDYTEHALQDRADRKDGPSA